MHFSQYMVTLFEEVISKMKHHKQNIHVIIVNFLNWYMVTFDMTDEEHKFELQI